MKKIVDQTKSFCGLGADTVSRAACEKIEVLLLTFFRCFVCLRSRLAMETDFVEHAPVLLGEWDLFLWEERTTN